MEITQEKDGALLVLRPKGRLDSANAHPFEEKMTAALSGGETNILVDFSELNYISSAGLRVLLMGAKRTQAAKGKIVLCALNDNIREVFEVSGFLSIFKVYPTRAEAVAAG